MSVSLCVVLRDLLAAFPRKLRRNNNKRCVVSSVFDSLLFKEFCSFSDSYSVDSVI